jgi:hypothetical protein
MKKLGIILFGLLLLVQPVQGQDYTPNLSPPLPYPGTVQYAYNYPGNFIVASWNSVYVGPYEGTLMKIGSDPTNVPISLYCVDFTHYALTNKVINAGVSNLGGGDVSGTRLGASGLEAYKKAAFLSSMFSTYTSVAQFAGLNQAQAFSGIHAAIWYFTTGGGPYTGDPYWTDFRDYAIANYGSYADYGEWSVLTTQSVEDFRIQDSQEFLVQDPTVSPEPQAFLLVASGLILLVFVGRRRLKEQGYV